MINEGEKPMPPKPMREFRKIYGDDGDIREYFAPGRVNLIGEHIDYNGGHVFPCALTVGTYLVARKRTDTIVNFYSANYKRGGVIARDLNSLSYDKSKVWTNYPFGVLWAIIQKGFPIKTGFDIYVYGNIPGSGLSSSASIEVAMGTMLQDMEKLPLSKQDIALISQKAENEYNGCNCGIMDQFASAMASKKHALFLDCATLQYEDVPLELKGVKIILANSNKPHSLVSSHYNDRRRECEEALKLLQQKLPIKNLCELTPEEFEENKYLIQDEILLKRAKHAVYEEYRTKEAVKALKENNIERFATLINESGDSLRYDYDATCFEIDTLVDEARNLPYVLGSRETGGGWGGNTISIVREDCVDQFIEHVSKAYKAKTSLRADFSVLEVGFGGRRIL